MMIRNANKYMIGISLRPKGVADSQVTEYWRSLCASEL
jgi:hypothetical protein